MATFAPTSLDTSPMEQLTGAVERVTFHSEETGFCVLRVKVRGHRDLVTVVGTAATITPGEYIEGQGAWVNDRKVFQRCWSAMLFGCTRVRAPFNPIE